MRLILLIAILFSVKLSVFGQTVWDSKELSNAIDVVKKEPCIILFYDKFLSTDLQKQHIEQIQVLFEVPVKIIDSIFFEEKNLNLKLTLFYVLCSKHREKVTENHLEVLRSNQKITLCHGTNTESLPLNDAATFIYEITVPVKEKIRNKETLNLYHEALDLWYKDPVDYDKMISLLNKADSLEPNNPIILDARGNARFNSKLDVEGGMDDFQKAIDYSMDQKNLAIRHHNRAMIYFELGKPDLACEDWIKGGENSTFFIDEYCNRSIDTTINPNIDQKVLFTMTSKRDTIVIQPEDLDLESYMPFTCYAELTIQNKSNNAITFSTGAINLGFERMDEALYLEAVSEDGEKVHFFTGSEATYSGGEKKLIINPGKTYNMTQDLTFLYHFDNPGKYKIRLVLRPTKDSSGLEGIYYSNWLNFIVVNYKAE